MEMTIRARDRRGGRARTPMHALTHTGEKGRYRGGRTERTETLGVARYGEKGGVERELGWKERGERKRETKRNETKERKKERKKRRSLRGSGAELSRSILTYYVHEHERSLVLHHYRDKEAYYRATRMRIKEYGERLQLSVCESRACAHWETRNTYTYVLR